MELYRKISDKPSIIWINGEVVAERIDAGYYHVNHIQLNKSKIPMFKISTYCSLSKKRFNPNKYNKEYFKYIDISNVDNNTGVFKYQLVNIKEAPSRARKKVSKNDIIISTVRPNRNAVAIINIEDDELVVSTGFAVIECKKNIDSYYLFAVLKTSNSIGQLVRKTSGGLYPAVSEQDVMGIEIPIPSPEIQKYIGDKVRKAEVLREEAKRLKKEAEEIFNQNYEVISKNNSKFEWVSSYYLNEDNVIPNFYKQYQLLRDKKYVYIEFENIVESIKCGIPVRSDMRIGDIYPFYGASGVTDNIGNYNFDGEYLIVAQDGSIGSVNVTRNKFWANNHVWVVKVKNGWDLEFLELYLNQYNYWISLTTGSVVPKVTSENLKKLLVPKINYEIQKSIGDKIREAKHKEQRSKALIEQAKQDVEDLIEDNFSMK